jgi:hypothetical protein
LSGTPSWTPEDCQKIKKNINNVNNSNDTLTSNNNTNNLPSKNADNNNENNLGHHRGPLTEVEEKLLHSSTSIKSIAQMFTHLSDMKFLSIMYDDINKNDNNNNNNNNNNNKSYFVNKKVFSNIAEIYSGLAPMGQVYYF